MANMFIFKLNMPLYIAFLFNVSLEEDNTIIGMCVSNMQTKLAGAHGHSLHLQLANGLLDRFG
jgi:hypothetical protein